MALALSWTALLLLLALPICAQTQSPDSAGASASDAIPTYKVGGGVSAPSIIYGPDPEYSEQARAARYQGTCLLSLIVGADGLPRDVKVTHPLGMGLDEQAIKAVSSWKFKPGMKDGEPVAVQIKVEVTFHLYENPKIDALITKSNDGDADASFELYEDYLGGHDVTADEHHAIEFLETAAKQGLPKAQFTMGQYVSSHGNDFVAAYLWYALAERGHYKHSDKEMKKLASKMSPAQLADAKSRVEATPKTPAKY